MTSQTDRKELQNTSCQISQRSKISQTRKFGQLIEYNIRLFFLKSHTVNMMKRLALGLFSKIKVGRISGSTVLVFIQFDLFLLYV